MNEKCFCHLNGYEVKDAEARRMINKQSNMLSQSIANEASMREGADNALAQSIANETTNRINAIKDLKNKKYILIGDSYGDGFQPDGTFITGWCNEFKNMLGLSDNECYIAHEGSNGFAMQEGLKFIELLEGIQCESPEEITHIIVAGGYNDNFFTYNEITNAIRAFCERVSQLYPNAMIYCGMVGWNTLDALMQNKLYNVFKAYSEFKRENYTYLFNTEFSLHSPSLMASDGYHPIEKGEKIIALNLINALNKGCNNLHEEQLTMTLYNDEKIPITHRVQNENSYIDIGTIYKIGISPLSLLMNWELNEIATLPFCVRVDDNFCMMSSIIEIGNDETTLCIPANLYVKGNKLYLNTKNEIGNLNITKLIIPHLRFNFPSIASVNSYV